MFYIQNPFKSFLNKEISLGQSVILNPKSILIILLAFLITWIFLKTVKKIVYRALSEDAKIKFESIFSFFNYFIYLVVTLTTINSIGIDLTGFLAASAALLVGVGLALQTSRHHFRRFYYCRSDCPCWRYHPN